MKHAPTHFLVLGLALVTAALAEPRVDLPDPVAPEEPTQNAAAADTVKRDDPKIARALRSIPWAAGPIADAFKEALHTEEVVRDLDGAATRYLALVEKHRARGDDHMEGIAALSLFRLAEIRRKQGREQEARQYYGEVADEFEDWEPMASLSRQQLGLDPSDFLPRVERLEDDRPLTEKVERSLWKVRTRVCNDKFVLVTFEVEPDEKNPYEGMPERQKVETLHYSPDGPLVGHIASTRALGEPMRIGKILGNPIPATLATRVTGFGHAYDVPAGLRRTVAVSMAESDWTGYRNSTFDVKLALNFNDEKDDESKDLGVDFTLVTLPEAEARKLAQSRAVSLPKAGKEGWSFTLPPAPGEFEAMQRGKE